MPVDVIEPVARLIFVIHFAYCAIPATCPFCNEVLATIIPCLLHIQSHYPAHLAHLMENTSQRMVLYYQHYADNFLQTIFPNLPQPFHYSMLSSLDFRPMDDPTSVHYITLVVRPNRHFHRRLWEHRRRRYVARAMAQANPIYQVPTNNAQSMPNPNPVEEDEVVEIPNPNSPIFVYGRQDEAVEIQEEGLTRQYLEQLNQQYHVSGLDEPNGDNNGMDLNLSL